MGFFSALFGPAAQSAVAVVLDEELPYADPETHAQMLEAILSKAGVRASSHVHTILSPGIRERSRLITCKICEHYFKETLGAGYDEARLAIVPFDAPTVGTSGVIVSHP